MQNEIVLPNVTHIKHMATTNEMRTIESNLLARFTIRSGAHK